MLSNSGAKGWASAHRKCAIWDARSQRASVESQGFALSHPAHESSEQSRACSAGTRDRELTVLANDPRLAGFGGTSPSGTRYFYVAGHRSESVER